MKSAIKQTTAPTKPSPSSQPLVIGIGSPHGDDRAGWEVVERLRAMDLRFASNRLHKAAVPHDALDWFDPQTTTHVVDAIAIHSDRLLRFELARDPQGNLQTLLTDQDQGRHPVAFPALRSHSTHQFDLRSVLELAAALNTLPRRIVLWAIPIEINATPTGTLDWSATDSNVQQIAALPHATLERHIQHAVQRIAHEIAHA
jgi:hydrogenase maturation protease